DYYCTLYMGSGIWIF
nr:immunoglobulin light chain junction region [Macaca mulatta]MOW28292.1 immunoglobulin light chain junction region [Macaca mulatta]MOW28605.1 immunoglobulin light chain junction region [Macaca mulatta]MOW28649.1 immunoglobulin light chain junction region [Macaca mulatta]MOW28922.1 immunoglobulin light chain junction region [Macaca mulatta]